MIKLFALDMDGTLLDSNHKVSNQVKNAIEKLNAGGVITVLCSGRVATSIEYFNKILGFDNPIIGNNGAVVKIDKDVILFGNKMDDQHLKDVIEFCEENHLMYRFYDEDTYYSNSLDFKALDHFLIERDYGMNLQVNLNISNNPFEKLRERNRKAYKILISNISKHPYGVEKIYRLLKEKFEDKLYITSSGLDSFEIMEKGVNKWNGIIKLAEFLGINNDEIASIGDSHNDLPMLEGAFLSFAMGNADDFVKSRSKYIVSDNNSGGVVEASDIILEYNKENPSV